eukprot:gnl/MRDRNA2_/MRDRNA2_116430_c0_seq1.p1 gnl/MRDRNA2_/MRDRNA2_116430_c0~~gnl/MRDRNA2_/MRDRNA2_116430_c0_seq1.p1  ORF type:complete len:445 (-),score=95.72 gnl/MRDRNA2_/MRDRNA2_116430_c0_seq1:33-1367(-)
MPLGQGADSGESCDHSVGINDTRDASSQSGYKDPGIVADSASLDEQAAETKQKVVSNGEHAPVQADTLLAQQSIQLATSTNPQDAQGLGQMENGIADCPPGFGTSSGSQPAEPRMPVGWRAIWKTDDQKYYFWHVPTNFTTYEAPLIQKVLVDVVQAEKYCAEEDARQAYRLKQIHHLANITGSNELAQELLEKHHNVEAAVRAHYLAKTAKARQPKSPIGKEQFACGPEACTNNSVQGLKKAWGKAKRNEAGAAVTDRVFWTGTPKSGVSKASSISAWSKGPGSAASSKAVGSTMSPTVHTGKEYVCSEHWQPQPDHEGCISVHHGDRFLITWTDDFTGGWAYGVAVDDKSRIGYIPQSVLKAPQRPISVIATGEHRKVLEAFQAPQDMGGFVSLHPDDEVTIMHAGSPCVWVYVDVTRVSEAGEFKFEQGWAPEMVLSPKSI